MRMILTGTTGKVGSFLAQYWQSRYEVSCLTRQEVDLQDEKALASYLDVKRFDILLNCAALSTPEGCEADPAQAVAVNTRAPGVMARVCREKGARFFHLSTDYVLDGSTPGYKDEESPTAASQAYGSSKLAGEQAALAANSDAVIARVAWVFGTGHEAFLEKIYRLALAGEDLEAVADKYSMPTAATELAEGLEVLFSPRARGVYHLTQSGEEPVSWHRYAQEVVHAMYQQTLLQELPAVASRQMSEIPFLASSRPRHTAMTPRRLRLEFGHEMRNWRDVVRERVAQLAKKPYA